MVREFIFRGILGEIDARQASEDEGSGVGLKLHLGGDFDVTNVFERIGEGIEGRNQVVAAAELKLLNGTLAIVEHDGGDVILDFGGVLLHVGERASETLFLSGPKDEAHSAPRVNSAFYDGIGGGKNARDADAIVRAAFAEIPGIEVCADHNNLLGMLAADDFADDVGAFDRAIGEFVLNIDMQADVFALG